MNYHLDTFALIQTYLETNENNTEMLIGEVNLLLSGSKLQTQAGPGTCVLGSLALCGRVRPAERCGCGPGCAHPLGCSGFSS